MVMALDVAERLKAVMEARHEVPLSSRGRFLHGCLDKELMPRAGLLVRKVTGSGRFKRSN